MKASIVKFMRIGMVAASTILTAHGRVSALPLYHVTDLGTLGGTESYAFGINNNGQVAGYSFTSGNSASNQRAFRTGPNLAIHPLTDNLGTLGGNSSSATAINDLGQVVGNSYLSNNSTSHGFRTGPNASIQAATDDLGTLGGIDSSAWAINNLGQVAGNSFTSGNAVEHAFRTGTNVTINPATDDLGTLGGTQSGAFGINNHGQVVGYSYIGGDTFIHAFRTFGNATIHAATDDIGLAVGNNSSAYGINESGQSVGAAYFAGNILYDAFRTGPNAAINPLTDDLGTLAETTSSNPRGVNINGWVVGYLSTATIPVYHAFLQNGTSMLDLNSALDASGTGWVLNNANDINDHNQIAGYGTINDTVHAFRLDPVPEPSTFILAALGALVCRMGSARRW